MTPSGLYFHPISRGREGQVGSYGREGGLRVCGRNYDKKEEDGSLRVEKVVRTHKRWLRDRGLRRRFYQFLIHSHGSRKTGQPCSQSPCGFRTGSHRPLWLPLFTGFRVTTVTPVSSRPPRQVSRSWYQVVRFPRPTTSSPSYILPPGVPFRKMYISNRVGWKTDPVTAGYCKCQCHTLPRRSLPEPLVV